MPSQTTTVGGTTIPLPAGAADTAADDIAVSGLLDYLAFWTKQALDAKIANQGPPTVQTVSSASPTTARYPFDPGHMVGKVEPPALFVWWDGECRHVPRTMVYTERERTLKALYVFPVTKTRDGGVNMRRGLMAAVDAAWHMAAERGRHPSYGYDGAAPGTPLYRSLSLVEWEYRGAVEGFLQELLAPNVRDKRRPEGGIQQGYPALEGTFAIRERIDPPVLVDPTDVTKDFILDLQTNESGDTADTLSIMQRYMVAPDGSEDGDE